MGLRKDHVILVHAFRKRTNGIPKKEIKVALKRMGDFILRYEGNLIKLGGK